MTPSTTDRDARVRILAELNRNYVRAIDEADTAWFENHLADDFMNMNPDGALRAGNRVRPVLRCHIASHAQDL